jgi:hypothetical protein
MEGTVSLLVVRIVIPPFFAAFGTCLTVIRIYGDLFSMVIALPPTLTFM